MKFPVSFSLIFVTLCVMSCAAKVGSEEINPEQLQFFESKVRPLLVTHCYECHSAESEEIKGGLRLDTPDGWLEGGDSGAAIEPGNVAGSIFMSAVRYDDFEMPPKGKLPDEQIAVFAKWIDMGAPAPQGDVRPVARTYEKEIDFEASRQFWAFKRPVANPAPTIKDDTWPLDDVDRFILARLEAEGIAPVGDADRRTWLRRVTYDLIGLPPTEKEAEAFLADESQAAHARVVDRLLASSRYGEHWGRHWLDVARYADSNGSDFNATFFNAWRYRNYVINSMNADKQFDQFVREQLAGDLLPHENSEQRAEQLIATGFLMLGTKMLSERDKEKLTMDVADEQVDTVGRAFLGMTLGCARCHDHKFDPIPTSDYYALAGIFTSTETLYGESQQYVSAWRESDLPLSRELAAALAEFDKKKAEGKSKLNAARADLKSAQERLAGKSALLNLGVLVDDTEATKVGQWKPSTYTPKFVGKGYVHDDNAEKGSKSITFSPKLPTAGQYEVRMSYTGGSGRSVGVPVTVLHANGTTNVKVDQKSKPPIDGLFKTIGRYHFEAGEGASVTISTEGTEGHVIADAVHFIAVAELAKLDEKAESDDSRSKALQTEIDDLAARVKKFEAALKTIEKDAPERPKAMAAREAEKVGDCQVCIRGEHTNRSDEVPRGFLQIVGDEPRYVANRKQSGRAELADWIAAPDNPLTARVIVNRVWNYMFGAGIVASVDNFGQLGQRPTHLELLDRLAIDFVEDGWSIKRLVRRLALSRTYQLSSSHDEKNATADPENQFLWRAARKRLPAEAIRDSLLAISGQLDATPGKSPVRGMGRLAVDNTTSQGGGLGVAGNVKRSVYLPIVRNVLPEILTVFDFADPDVVTGQRPVTNVPAQALLLLNSPFVGQCAQRIAERLLKEKMADDDDRITMAYKLILNREPSPPEHERAVEFIGDADDNQAEASAHFVRILFASTEFRILN